MKKAVVYMLVMAFVFSIVSVAFARTIDEERDAVRSYLKVIDAKIIKYRKAGNTAKMKVLQADKRATLARWEKLKAQMAATPAPPPVMAPVQPPPPPMVSKPAPVKSAGLFGMGMKTVISGSYISTGYGKINGAFAGRADLMLDDMLKIGSLMGLPADSLKYRVGVGLVYGTGYANLLMKAIPAYADVVINLPAAMMGGIETYVGGGIPFTLYGTGATMGPTGLDLYAGMKKDLGLGMGLGKTCFELGYYIVRSGGADVKRSVKGITLSIGQELVI